MFAVNHTGNRLSRLLVSCFADPTGNLYSGSRAFSMILLVIALCLVIFVFNTYVSFQDAVPFRRRVGV